jgi:transposase-like protein
MHLERRAALRRYYERGRSVAEAWRDGICTEHTAYHWYRRWLREDGDKAPTCACGRELIHGGRCLARGNRAGNQRGWPVYTGPAVIGRALSEGEVAHFRELEATSKK